MITIFLLALLAAADPIGCPKTIQVKEQLASLAPDGTTPQRNETVSTWKFELPRHTSTCAVTYARGVTIAGLPVIDSVKCN
jgi:hypothetical protein